MTEDLTRRRLFGLAGATAVGAAGLGLGGCTFGSKDATHKQHGTALATTVSDTGQGFVTRPDLTPPQITVRHSGLGPDSQYIFLDAPYSGPGHGGTMMLNSSGELVWMGPSTLTEHRLNFSVQSYQGQQVLTWWQGLVTEGYGKGECVIANSSYRTIQSVKTGNGVDADLHEFNITPQGTALLTAYRTHSGVDLTAVHGPSNGYLLSGVAQEIDIATGKVLYEFDSWAGPRARGKAGVALTETYEKIGPGDGGFGTVTKPFNYFHINSIAPWDDDHLLISGRNTWTVYLWNKITNQIVWRMHGRNSDFSMGPRASFFWQHHVRPLANNVMTVFDNGANPAEEKNSRAIVLDVDTTAMTVKLKQAFIHPGVTVLSGAEGSAQLLSNNGMFVGWGSTPRFSQFAPDGKLVLDGVIVKGAPSYRAFTQTWAGHPTDKPAAAARHGSSGNTVYASWNGATNIGSWAVFAGKTAATMKQIGTAKRAGFETAISVKNAGPYFAVEALSPKGQSMGKSAAVKLA
jgi:Arylsulfotransferase (ASST)